MTASGYCVPALEFPIISREQLATAWEWLSKTMRQQSRRLFGEQSWTEDVVQDTLLCLWRDWPENAMSFAGQAQLLKWLRTAHVRQALKTKAQGGAYVLGNGADDAEDYDALPAKDRFQGRIASPDESARLWQLSRVLELLSPAERASFERFIEGSQRSRMTATERSRRRRMLVRLCQLLKQHGFRE
jgi:DNA-directed RNA polymerase specialized sigma24 family protein